MFIINTINLIYLTVIILDLIVLAIRGVITLTGGNGYAYFGEYHHPTPNTDKIICCFIPILHITTILSGIKQLTLFLGEER